MWSIVATLAAMQATGQIGPAPTPLPVPPMGVGNEADRKQLAFARRQGAALIGWERQGAAWSGQTDAADYRLAAAISAIVLERRLTWHVGAGVGVGGKRDGFIAQSILTAEFNVIRPNHLVERRGR